MFAHRFFSLLARCGAVAKNDRHAIGYASGNFGKAILLGTVDVTLLFLLTDIVGIAPVHVSRLMMVVFAGDLVFDFVAGLVAGKAERHGIGYARLIALLAPPCALVFGAIYSLPLFGIHHGAVVTALILCLRFTYALIDVPHNSLLARVTADSHARGRASGYRTIFSSAAAVSVACVIAPLMHTSERSTALLHMAWLGVAGGLLFCAALLLAAYSSKPAPVSAPISASVAAPPRSQPFSPRMLLPAPDRLFAAMAGIALITGFAVPMFTKTLLYLCTYVLQSPEFAGRILLVLAISQIAGAAFWIALVRRQDKSALLAVSHGVAAVGILLFAAAGNKHGALLACTVLIGIGFAGVFMLPWGILADIIDFSEFRHRERRETMSFVAVLVLLKGGGAVALVVIGWVLGTLGYVPGAVQAPSVLLGMKGLAFAVPAAGSVLAILILRRMDIGHERHARVRKVNQVRKERLAYA